MAGEDRTQSCLLCALKRGGLDVGAVEGKDGGQCQVWDGVCAPEVFMLVCR